MWFYFLCFCIVGYFVVKIARFLKIRNLHERHVFITGCDGGFGRKLCVELDKMGLHVYAGCLLDKSVEELTEQCSSRFKALKVDVTKSSDLRQAAKVVKQCLGDKALWGLVNNAGIANSSMPLDWLNKEDYKQVLDVNLLGVIDTTMHFFPLIRKGKEGRIVNIASQYGRFAPTSAPYMVSKFGVEGFSDGLSKEADLFNVTVHTLEPGFFKTGILNGREKEIEDRWRTLDPAVKQAYGEEFLQQLLKVVEKVTEQSSPQVDLVVNAYIHALVAKYPKERYIIGNDAKYFHIPLSYLPNFLQIPILKYVTEKSGVAFPSPAEGVKKMSDEIKK